MYEKFLREAYEVKLRCEGRKLNTISLSHTQTQVHTLSKESQLQQEEYLRPPRMQSK